MSRVVTWVLILACLQIFALLARDASAAELPPGQLPDARAYEQVTPIQKNGLDVASGMSSIQAAADGSAITYASNGGIAGGTGAQQYPLYIARRGSTEWKTAGLLPPAATGPSALLYGWNPNLSEAYVGQAGSRAAPGTLYQSDTATTSRLGVATGGPIEDFRWIGSSQEGGVVLFETNGATLTPEARTGAANAYVWDRATGTIRLAGVSNAGDSFADGSFGGPYNWYFENPLESGAGRGEAFYSGEENDISSDGSRVFVTAAATGQIFLRENPTREQSPLTREGECAYPALACTVQISASQKTNGGGPGGSDPNGPRPAALISATPDGRFAFFTSSEELTNDANTGPADEGRDLYRFDSTTDTLLDLTPDATDATGAEVQGVLGTSDDGSYVYFAANGVLAAGATLGDCEQFKGVEKHCNLYLWHSGTTEFISELEEFGKLNSSEPAPSDASDWLPQDHTEGETFLPKSSRVTPDGKVLLFRSRRNLVAGNQAEGSPQLYRYEAETHRLLCVSCRPDGGPSLRPSTLRSLRNADITNPGPRAILSRNLSANGERVFFETAEALLPSDVNEAADVYEWEEKGEGSCSGEAQNGGCLYLISSGTGSSGSYFADASESGDDVFFFTRQGLVRQDQDELVDLYDARVGGGIAAQNAEPPSPCVGEAGCRGPAGGPPSLQGAGTPTFVGSGNRAPQKPKRRHRRHHKKRGHHRHGHRAKKQGRKSKGNAHERRGAVSARAHQAEAH